MKTEGRGIDGRGIELRKSNIGRRLGHAAPGRQCAPLSFEGQAPFRFADKTLPARLRYYANPDWLIIDEFGFDKIERAECPEVAPLVASISIL